MTFDLRYFFCVLTLPIVLFSQARAPAFTAQEVGINEKLGQTIALDTVLKDEANQSVTLRSLIDKPTILSLNYFRCAGICTPQLGGMAEVFDKTQAEPGKDFQVITVSFDPRDTPDMAAQKRENYLHEIKRHFPQAAWRFLTGDATATQALADSVGFRFKPQGDDFIHPAALYFLSPKGEITRLLLTRHAYAVDIPAVLEAAAATGTIIELNANPRRLDLDWRWWRRAKELGVKCAINPDAHRTSGLQDLWFGVAAARKGWLTKDEVVNCLPLGQIEKALAKKRASR